jgi:hypothetical protein
MGLKFKYFLPLKKCDVFVCPCPGTSRPCTPIQYTSVCYAQPCCTQPCHAAHAVYADAVHAFAINAHAVHVCAVSAHFVYSMLYLWTNYLLHASIKPIRLMYSRSLLSPAMCEIMRSWNRVPTVKATSSQITYQPFKGIDLNVLYVAYQEDSTVPTPGHRYWTMRVSICPLPSY